MITEFKVGEIVYRADRLNAFEQWDVARRILPVVGGAAEVFVRYIKEQKEAGTAFKRLLEMEIAEIIEPLGKALAAMSDDDSRFVLVTCMSKVTRQVPGGQTWAPIITQNGVLVFMDIEMPQMLQIVWKVIEANLMNFSSALPGTSSATGRA